MEAYQKEALKLGNQLCFPLYAAARRITGLYTPVLKPLGITYTQYLVMLVLWEEERIAMGELGDRLYLDSGTLTPLLKKMEAAGLIARERCRDDERCMIISLTDQGWALQEKASEVPFAVGSCVRLSGEEAGTLHRLLYKVLKGEEDHE